MLFVFDTNNSFKICLIISIYIIEPIIPYGYTPCFISRSRISISRP